MSDANFDIIFLGRLQSGHTLAEVKPRLMQLFKVDATKIDAIFSGAAVPLKRNLDPTGAKKYQTVLARAGIKVQIRPSNASAAAAKPDAEGVRNARLVAQAKRRAELAATVTASKPLSMSVMCGDLLDPPNRKWRARLADTPQCPFCAHQDATLEHLFAFCLAFAAERPSAI